VIRIGKVFDILTKKYITEDPIEEIDKVLNNFETCLFAKFGKQLNIKRIQRLANQTDLYIIVVASNSGKKHVSKTYKLISSTREISADAANYPEYYQGREGFVGTWLEVRNSSYQASLTDLYVASSFEKLLVSMSSSMSSFFFCKL
jgi:hypothetical protein